jgi:hypothetical protein
MQDPTRRFSDRVSYYAKFRPGYPEQLLAYLGKLFPLPAVVSFRNFQDLDREGFKGRLLSSSYVPIVGQPGHEEIVETAEQIFAKYEQGGKVTVEYETKLYLGRWRQE